MNKFSKLVTYSKLARPTGLLSIIFVAVFIVIGVTALVLTKAATPFLSLEPENGTRTTNATLISDATASGSNAVRFTTGTPPPGDCPAYPSFPDTTCTGYAHTGVALATCSQYKDSNGGYTIDSTTTAGITVDGCNFDAGVKITGKGPIVLKRSLVRPAGCSTTGDDDSSGYGITIGNITGSLLIEDTEVVSSNTSDPLHTCRIMSRPIVDYNCTTVPVTLNRVWAHHSRTGVDFTCDKNISITNSYLGPTYNPVLPSQTTTSCTNRAEDRQHGSGMRLAGGVANLNIINTVVMMGVCGNTSGLFATYPEGGANHDITIDGGLWVLPEEGYGIAAGYTKASEEQNYNYTVKNVQISTQYNSSGCPSSCGQNWNQGNYAPIGPLGGTKIWQNVTKYNPGKPDHGQPIGP